MKRVCVNLLLKVRVVDFRVIHDLFRQQRHTCYYYITSSFRIYFFSSRYVLYGVTIHHGEHFSCKIKIDDHWYNYDGLKGALSGQDSSLAFGSNETPNFLVYVKE